MRNEAEYSLRYRSQMRVIEQERSASMNIVSSFLLHPPSTPYAV